MGVNTKGIMSSDVRFEDVINILEDKFGVQTEIENTYYNDYKIITFNYNGEERRLSMWVDYTDFDYDFIARDVKEITLIHLNLWGSSTQLIEGILEDFGGGMVDADISGVWRHVEKIWYLSKNLLTKSNPHAIISYRVKGDDWMRKIKKSEVFNSYNIFPAMWHLYLAEAQKKGYRYIDFNGMVFKAVEQSPEFKNCVCKREDLIDA